MGTWIRLFTCTSLSCSHLSLRSVYGIMQFLITGVDSFSQNKEKLKKSSYLHNVIYHGLDHFGSQPLLFYSTWWGHCESSHYTILHDDYYWPLMSRLPMLLCHTGWPSLSSPKNPPGMNLVRTSGGVHPFSVESMPNCCRNSMCCVDIKVS